MRFLNYQEELQVVLHLEALINYVAEQLRLEKEKNRKKKIMQKLEREVFG